MKHQLIKVLFYGNTEKKDYRNVSSEIVENNRKHLIVYTMITTIALAIMIFASFFAESLVKNRRTYFVGIVISLLLLLVAYCFDKNQKGKRAIIYISQYVFIAALIAFGIILGTVIEPEQLSVSFLVILFAVPLLFTDMPIRMNMSSVIGIIVYVLMARETQSDTMFGYNMSNVLPYGAISIILSNYMLQIKIRSYVLEYENGFLIETDQLTGLLNRRSFENNVQLLRTNGICEGMMVCTFDVNGLKKINDNLGHHAGDELIRGAANCINGVFGAYGHCYRIGGDEFMAITEGAAPSVDELKKALDMRCSCFNGVYVSGLSISIGIIEAKASDQIDELIKNADQAMYEDKAHYYEVSGRDRRQR